jgi:UrcA family protein
VELNDASDIRIADSVAQTKIANIETFKWLQETKMFTTARNGLVTLVATLATGAALLCAPAHAGSVDPEIPTIAVGYADLDLTSEAGVTALYRRLQAAAKQVCSPFASHEIGRALKRRACYNQALSDAVTKINVELLSVLHRNASAPPRVS